MTLDDFRSEMEAFWERVDSDGRRAKSSQLALSELERFYNRLDEGDRELALAAFTDWIFGTDARRQFAGLAMIDRFSIRAALPSLRTLADLLEYASGPAAPYDWAKVNRIIGRLSSPAKATEG